VLAKHHLLILTSSVHFLSQASQLFLRMTFAKTALINGWLKTTARTLIKLTNLLQIKQWRFSKINWLKLYTLLIESNSLRIRTTCMWSMLTKTIHHLCLSKLLRLLMISIVKERIKLSRLVWCHRWLKDANTRTILSHWTSLSNATSDAWKDRVIQLCQVKIPSAWPKSCFSSLNSLKDSISMMKCC